MKQIHESGYKTAALANGANYNATLAKRYYKDINALEKMNMSANIRLPALHVAICDNFPNLILHFIETNKVPESYSVDFTYDEIKSINNKRFVLYGDMLVMNKNKSKGYIEYHFKTGNFYHVRYYANGIIRRIYSLEIDEDYKVTFCNFLHFLSCFLYSEENNRTTVDQNGPTMSK